MKDVARLFMVKYSRNSLFCILNIKLEPGTPPTEKLVNFVHFYVKNIILSRDYKI